MPAAAAAARFSVSSRPSHLRSRASSLTLFSRRPLRSRQWLKSDVRFAFAVRPCARKFAPKPPLPPGSAEGSRARRMGCAAAEKGTSRGSGRPPESRRKRGRQPPVAPSRENRAASTPATVQVGGTVSNSAVGSPSTYVVI
jgi:hypothetical protein